MELPEDTTELNRELARRLGWRAVKTRGGICIADPAGYVSEDQNQYPGRTEYAAWRHAFGIRLCPNWAEDVHSSLSLCLELSEKFGAMLELEVGYVNNDREQRIITAVFVTTDTKIGDEIQGAYGETAALALARLALLWLKKRDTLH